MEMSSMPSEQHLPYRSTADVVVLDGDGSRWVKEDVSRKPIRKVEAWCVVDFGGGLRVLVGAASHRLHRP